ncbi:MAG: hypothetical protein LQ351_008121 [Letrouitia transgressa]|nr:MAG: hypothetical protein LQ351_008121 [Letrouitia transgressa]
MALVTASTSLVLGTMPVPTPTTTGTTTAASPSTTCAGQLVSPPAQPMSCNALSAQYGVTTGDLTVITNDWACQFSTPICLPLPCDTLKIGWGETCTGLTSATSGISFTDMRTFNTQINADCTNLWLGYSYCVAQGKSNTRHQDLIFSKSVQSPSLQRAPMVSAGRVMEMQSAPELPSGTAAPTMVTVSFPSGWTTCDRN